MLIEMLPAIMDIVEVCNHHSRQTITECQWIVFLH